MDDRTARPRASRHGARDERSTIGVHCYARRVRRLSLVTSLLLTACPDPEDDGFDAFSSTNPTTATTTTTAGTSTGESTGGESSSSTGVPDESSSTAIADETSSSSSAGELPVCGNGVLELGEQCDDGNDSDMDECTIECAVPRCNDRALNGDETDLDCGGSCQGCELCLVCADDDDCAQGLSCSDASQCIVHEVMSVHWNANCGGVAQGHTIPDLPLGVYVATPLPSAGTLWLPPYTPPSTGYFYEVQCGGGVQLTQIRTPVGVRYSSVAAAFAALQADSQEFNFLGGDLTCYRTDDTCEDNSGSVDFAVDYSCDAN